MDSEKLHSLFAYSDGILTWKFRPIEDFKSWKGFKITNSQKAGKPAGCVNELGYVVIGYHNKLILAHRVVWTMFHGDVPDGFIIDHIDGNCSNNKIENLRLSTKSTNGMNRPAPSNNKTGIKGVSWYEARKKWVAQIKAKGIYKNKHFAKKEDAEAWVTEQRLLLHLDFANSEPPKKTHISNG